MLFVTSSRLSMLLFGLLPIVVVPVLIYGRKVRKLSREPRTGLPIPAASPGKC